MVLSLTELCFRSVCQSSRLDGDKALECYLKLDLSQSKCSLFSKIFGKRPKGSGRCLSIPLNVRGASINPFETVKLCHWFYFLKNKDQVKVRNLFMKQPAGEKKRRKALLVKAVEHLIKSSTKGAAVVEIEEGYSIANMVGFDLLSNEGYSSSNETNNENEEEEDSLFGDDSLDDDDDDSDVVEHVGIGSSHDQVEAFVEERLAKRRKSKARRRRNLAPTKTSHLCLAMNNESEFSLFKRFAKHLDRTFVEKQPRNAPKWTAVLIILNEVHSNENAGGKLQKNICHNVRKIQILSNNEEEMKYIFSHMKKACKKDSERLYDDNTSMSDSVKNYITTNMKERANPSKKRKEMVNIADDIDVRGQRRRLRANSAFTLRCWRE